MSWFKKKQEFLSAKESANRMQKFLADVECLTKIKSQEGISPEEMINLNAALKKALQGACAASNDYTKALFSEGLDSR